MNRIILLLLIILFSSCSEDGNDTSQIKDGSGNIYTEIKIGNQTWLKEDLKTTKYQDGTAIGSVYCQDKGSSGVYYSNLPDFNSICPIGYRVPTKLDYEILINHFGGKSISENQIISAYVNEWNGNPNGSGDGIINNGSGLYWTSSLSNIGNYYFYFRTVNAGLSVDSHTLDSFFHIKCIKK